MAFKKLKARLRNRKLRKHGVVPDPDLRSRARPMGRPGSWDVWHIVSPAKGELKLVYSFGIGRDISFDLAIIEAHGVELHGFDPTSVSRNWLKQQNLPGGFHFHETGLSDKDGTISLFPPKHEHQHNFSQEKLSYVTDRHKPVEVPVNRLTTLMERLGHKHLDVLKIDIEGSEFEAIPDILTSGCSFDQLLVEIHYHYPTRSFKEGLELIETLRRAGYVCFYISDRGYEFGFIKQ